MQNKLMGYLLGCFLGVFSCAVFAADSVAKEDFTPPPAAGALTADQIKPIDTASLNKPPVQSAPPAPVTGQ